MNRFKAALSKIKPEGPDASILTYVTPSLEQPPLPGQFFMVRLLVPGFPLFGRALAVLAYETGLQEAEISFLVKEVGSGTAMLRSACPGDEALLVGPAGNSFPLIHPENSYIFVAGGTGMAAFRLLLDGLDHERSSYKDRLLFLYGARNKDSLYLYEDLKKRSIPLKVSTEDGSKGTQGLVTLLLEDALAQVKPSSHTVVFACGPDLMMKAVTGLCLSNKVPLFLSLEARMACGIGVCNGCTVEVVQGGSRAYARVCHEGPVFPAHILPFYSGGTT